MARLWLALGTTAPLTQAAPSAATARRTEQETSDRVREVLKALGAACEDADPAVCAQALSTMDGA